MVVCFELFASFGTNLGTGVLVTFPGEGWSQRIPVDHFIQPSKILAPEVWNPFLRVCVCVCEHMSVEAASHSVCAVAMCEQLLSLSMLQIWSNPKAVTMRTMRL